MALTAQPLTRLTVNRALQLYAFWTREVTAGGEFQIERPDGTVDRVTLDLQPGGNE